MKKNHAVLLLCSLSFITVSVGLGTWVNNFQFEYKENNKVQDRPVAYIVGKEDVKYTSIEKALDNAKRGDIVSIIPGTQGNYNSNNGASLPDKVTYEISRNCVIEEGVTLVIPTDINSFSSVKDENTLKDFVNSMRHDARDRGGNYGKNARDDENHYLRATVRINKGVTLTNKGKIIISGYLSGGSDSSGVIGQTTHSYTQIVLEENAKIIQDSLSAELHCYGYIHESENNNNSKVEILKGKLYIPLLIYDYRGFSFSFAMTVEAMPKYNSSPFNDFGIENIEAFTTVKGEAQVYGISNVYLSYSTMDVSQNFYNEILLTSLDDGAFVKFNSALDSSLTTKIDKFTKKIDLCFIGGATINSIRINLEYPPLKLALDTKDSYLPISRRYNLKFKKNENQSSALFDLTKQRVKFLPGSSAIVTNGVTIKMSDLAIYSAFFDGNTYSLKNESIGRTPVYPLKEAGVFRLDEQSFLEANSIGGVIYSNSEGNITYLNSSISCKEPWNIMSNPDFSALKMNSPWTIKDYLVINEKLSIKGIADLDKLKVYCGVNTFLSKENNLSSYIIHLNDSTFFKEINGYQEIIFLDELINCKIELKNNIYKIFNKNSLYKKDSVFELNNMSTMITSVNSLVPISDNADGINEYEPQGIEIACETPLIDGEVPLYPESNIVLKATVNNIDKIYNPIIERSSSDTSIASIDSNGKVLGKKIGDVTFTASCNGISQKFSTKVIAKGEIVPITSITISDDKKNTATLDTTKQVAGTFNFSNKYGNNSKIPITLKLNDGASWSSIEWKFTGTGADRNYLHDPTLSSETVKNVETVTVHTLSGTGLSDDNMTLICKVTDFEGNVFTMTLNLIHKKECIVEGTLIMISDGTSKKVEDLNSDDMVMTFNHFSGKLEPSKLFFNYHSNEQNLITGEILCLYFDNGTKIEIYEDHGFFDLTKKGYQYINIYNYQNFIGDEFVVIDSNLKRAITKLLKCDVRVKTVKVYSPVSVMHLNVITNNLLSITGEIEGWFNFFEYDSDLKYLESSIDENIKKYGLYDYEEFKDMISRYVYDVIPIKYLKISVGKGTTTLDNIKYVFRKYLSDK